MEENRVEKLLEAACINLSVVVSDIFEVSGREMIAALIFSDQNPKVLVQLAGPACAGRSANSGRRSQVTLMTTTASCLPGCWAGLTG